MRGPRAPAGGSQTPVRPSIVVASSPNGARVCDDRPLEVADVPLHVLAVAAEVEDRITDELARSVVGRLAAAVRLDELDVAPAGMWSSFACSVRRPVVTTGGMLDAARSSRGSCPATTAAASDALQLERLRVGDEAGVEEVGAAAHRQPQPG